MILPRETMAAALVPLRHNTLRQMPATAITRYIAAARACSTASRRTTLSSRFQTASLRCRRNSDSGAGRKLRGSTAASSLLIKTFSDVPRCGLALSKLRHEKNLVPQMFDQMFDQPRERERGDAVEPCSFSVSTARSRHKIRINHDDNTIGKGIRIRSIVFC